MALICTSPSLGSPPGSDTDATSYITVDSYTPGANNLQLFSVLNSRTGALPTIPTVTGCGLTWVDNIHHIGRGAGW